MKTREEILALAVASGALKTFGPRYQFDPEDVERLYLAARADGLDEAAWELRGWEHGEFYGDKIRALKEVKP